jgi:hypothetical protein
MDVAEQARIETDTPPEKPMEDIALEAAFGGAVLVAMAGWLYALGRGAIFAIGLFLS